MKKGLPGLISYEEPGYIKWFLRGLFLPCGAGFCLGQRNNERWTCQKYLLPIFLTIFVTAMGFVIEPYFLEYFKNAGRTDDEMRQIRFNYWIITTAIKLSIAAFAFRMLYLQRKRFIDKTQLEESGCQTCLISKLLFGFSFGQMGAYLESQENMNSNGLIVKSNHDEEECIVVAM